MNIKEQTLPLGLSSNQAKDLYSRAIKEAIARQLASIGNTPEEKG